MLRPFKQPIASFYCEKSYNVELMEKEIREAIKQLHDAKIFVKVIINDRGSNMISVRRSLCGDGETDFGEARCSA